jgi:sec-independent protein translocase protein TatC
VIEQQTSKKPPPPKKEAEMGFWDHLEVLRGHIFRSAAALLVFSIIAFIFKEIIFDGIILAPLDAHFITNRILCRLGHWVSSESLCFKKLELVLQNIELSGQFMMHLYVSFVAGLILAMPYIIFEIWRFILPALHENEKKYTRGAVFVISVLFLSGVFFGYFLIVPLTINFFGNYHVSEQVTNQIHLNSYISSVISIVMGIGIVFELPVLIYFLTKVGVVTPAFLKKNRKVMVVIVLVLASIITPPDVFSQILVSIPLLLLYELSIKVANKVYKSNFYNV